MSEYSWGIEDTSIIKGERDFQTTFTFADGTQEAYDWSGELNSQSLIDAGLKSNNSTWLKNPVEVRIGRNVTSINYAFNWCTSLSSVTIPDSVLSIGDYAFFNCTNLTGMTIPESVSSIGPWAFYNCTSLSSITIPNSVTSINWGAFEGCTSLSSVTIPNSVSGIGN